MPLLRQRRRTVLLLRLLLPVLVLACSDATAPRAASREALFAVTDHALLPIDPVTGRVVDHVGPVARYAVSALSADSGSVLVEDDDHDRATFYSVNQWGTSYARWLTLPSPSTSRATDALWFRSTAMAVGPQGRHLYVGRAFSVDPLSQPAPDSGRIAVIDLATRRLAGTIPGFSDVEEIRVLPPGPVAAAGAVLVIGARQAWDSLALYVIDPRTRAVVDSAVIPDGQGGRMWLREMVAAQDGERVYLVGGSQAYAYDLRRHQVVGHAFLTSESATIALAPDGRLYAVDPGFAMLGYPGSTSVQVFASDLTAERPLQFRDQSVLRGWMPTVDDVAASRDGRFLYLAAGDFREPTSVLVMERASGVVTRVIPLGSIGRAIVYSGR